MSICFPLLVNSIVALVWSCIFYLSVIWRLLVLAACITRRGYYCHCRHILVLPSFYFILIVFMRLLENSTHNFCRHCSSKVKRRWHLLYKRKVYQHKILQMENCFIDLHIHLFRQCFHFHESQTKRTKKICLDYFICIEGDALYWHINRRLPISSSVQLCKHIRKLSYHIKHFIINL